jgi:hypothetical protein
MVGLDVLNDDVRNTVLGDFCNDIKAREPQSQITFMRFRRFCTFELLA